VLLFNLAIILFHMLNIKVKAGSITHLTDARYFAAWGVEWLGFPLKSVDGVEIEPIMVKAIKEWVDGVRIVGEVNTPVDTGELNELIDQIGLDAIQAGDSINAANLKTWNIPVPIIKEIIINSGSKQETLDALIRQCAPYASIFLLNFEIGDFNFDRLAPIKKGYLRALCKNYPVILESNFKVAELTEILEFLPLHGISMKGGEEEKTGVKSFDQLDELFEIISDEVL